MEKQLLFREFKATNRRMGWEALEEGVCVLGELRERVP